MLLLVDLQMLEKMLATNPKTMQKKKEKKKMLRPRKSSNQGMSNYLDTLERSYLFMKMRMKKRANGSQFLPSSSSPTPKRVISQKINQKKVRKNSRKSKKIMGGGLPNVFRRVSRAPVHLLEPPGVGIDHLWLMGAGGEA